MIDNRNIIKVGCQTFPSYREGSIGFPVIVGDINGCNEIVENGGNGLIIPVKDTEVLYDSMQKIYQDEVLRHTLAQNSRKQIWNRYDKVFIWQTIKDEYDLLLSK